LGSCAPWRGAEINRLLEISYHDGLKQAFERHVGVSIAPLSVFSAEPFARRDWTDTVPIHANRTKDLPQGVMSDSNLRRCYEPREYLLHLWHKIINNANAGGFVGRDGTVNELIDVADPDVVINATGLGARKLAAMTPFSRSPAKSYSQPAPNPARTTSGFFNNRSRRQG